MVYLIREEKTIYLHGMSVRSKVIGYYECDNEEEVIDYCKKKTKELKGTYDEDRMIVEYVYKKIDKLN